MRAYLLAAVLLIALAGTAAAQTGRVTGIVKDDHGDPIKGATIIAEKLDASPSSFTASSDEKGRFAMIGLRSGVWQFRASAPGFASDGGELNVRTMPTLTAPVTFTLQKLVAPPSALGTTSPKDLQAALASADALYNNQQWDEAIAAYREILQRSPSLSVINLQIAAAYRNQEGLRRRDRRVQRAPQDRSDQRQGQGRHRHDQPRKGRPGHGRTDARDCRTGSRRDPRGVLRPRRSEAGPLSTRRGGQGVRARGAGRPDLGQAAVRAGPSRPRQGRHGGARKYFQIVIDIDPISPEAAQATTMLRQLDQTR